jgi:hypothetical protein
VLRRVVVAAAFLGLATTACDSDNEDVQGSCANAAPSGEPDCFVNCGCGEGGYCVAQPTGRGVCVFCDCDSDEYCDDQGTCHGQRSPSSGACYGAPPLPHPSSRRAL